MLLSDIFDIGLAYKGQVFDYKADKCEHIDAIEEAPFIKRCTLNKSIGLGLKVCRDHAFTVTYVMSYGLSSTERTNYFDTQYEAEFFRRHEVPLSWVETNYRIPLPKYDSSPVAKLSYSAEAEDNLKAIGNSFYGSEKKTR